MRSSSCRLALAALAALALTALLAGPAGAAPGTESAWRQETLHFTFANEHCKLQRVPEGQKPAFGDGDICRYDILETKTGKKVGHAGFSCGLVSDEEGVCDGTFVLPGGSLASAGDLVDGHQIAISGGTGRYKGALGQWHYGNASPLVTIELLLPRT